MCGIVGAVAQRNVVPILLEGLRRLEYRGYDSAGLAVIGGDGRMNRTRTVGKVACLSAEVDSSPHAGGVGIAHTRWATHGAPTEANAHPHVADSIAVVHNGIIENYEVLRERLIGEGYEFESQTDTEVIANLVLSYVRKNRSLIDAVRAAVAELEGAYAIGVVHLGEPDRVVAARMGSPLVIGIGVGEHFLASDVAALIPVTQQFIILEQGDLAELTRDDIRVIDAEGQDIERKPVISELTADAVERGEFRHYMLKEIYEQPAAIAATLEDRLGKRGRHGERIRARVRKRYSTASTACKSSPAALAITLAWSHEIGSKGSRGSRCSVEVASEFRYRHPVANPNTLLVTISQSGETADTLAALRFAQEIGFGPSLGHHQRAGELSGARVRSGADDAGRARNRRRQYEGLHHAAHGAADAGLRSWDAVTVWMRKSEARIVAQLRALPQACERVLGLDEHINILAGRFADKQHALFLGRGVQYPVAMEGALKLKEISYIHAEAYPAGELKHGPLALVDGEMPVVVVAPNDALLEKLKSNMEEVRARGGELYVFADSQAGVSPGEGIHVMEILDNGEHVTPIIYTVPLQLLSYHVAVLKGTDVDQPRNLAKSVTVE